METTSSMSTLIFEKSRAGRRAFAQAPLNPSDTSIPGEFLRDDEPMLPEASELQVNRILEMLAYSGVLES